MCHYRMMASDEFTRALLDPSAPIPTTWPSGAWGVLLLFLVPVGGGIPAGVLLARARGLSVLVMMALYFVSDVILACVFEPFLLGLRVLGRAVPPLGRFGQRFIAAAQWSGMRAGTGASGPLRLVLVAFSVDPMTGRAAAAAAGHGFLPGWAIAITGDMFYFALLTVSTLGMHRLLGDERLTVGAMLLVMFVVPSLVRRWRERR
jgi:hypothetical protein